MKNSILILVLFLFCFQLHAQNATYPLRLEKRAVYQNDVVVKRKEVKAILLNNSASSSEYKKCQTNSTIGSAFLLTGSALCCVGGYLSFAESRKALDETEDGNLNYKADYSSSIAIIGVALGCVVASIPFTVKAKKSFKKSIDLYNESLSTTSARQVDFNLNLSLTGARLTMTF
jgi:hypothetical protein